MGICYMPNKPGVENLNLNYSGCDILGFLGKHIEFNCYHNNRLYYDRIPYEGSVEQSIAFADYLDNIPSELLEEYCQTVVDLGWFDGNISDFIDLIKEYSNFFRNCNGYTAI